MDSPPGLTFGTVLGLLLHFSWGQNLLRQNSCVEYRSISLAPFNASVSSQVVLNGGPGSPRKIEVPSQSTWIPECDEDGLYVMRQRRQNNETFCVLPTTGEIVFDPIKKNHLDNSAKVYCDCSVERRLIRTGRHKDDIVPRCDEKTGRFKALQFYPNGKAQCVDEVFGDPTFGPFVYNDRNKDDILPRCDDKTGRFKALQFYPIGKAQCVDEVFGDPILKPFFYNGTSDKPVECVKAEETPMFISAVRGTRLDKDSKYD
ncbi:hypothetical protein BV898_18979 [Hypsibius exemplaris]|uniref:Thyroglobulin type-1 domain-containing protein n=1 Tax=Hypsibius exemplaris TaxID=2072580 RepID=A0A9X6NR14_HYPEX|nr:hypothetical protein BV898_18979 [Hypsibius exemplaris]